MNNFSFAVGIEDTFVTQSERGERPLDEYALTQHYEKWMEDLELARQTGASMIRYGIPWHQVEETKGTFNWTWVDQVMNYFRKHPGFVPIIDLVHYGTPGWMKHEFLNEEYPTAVARFAKAFFQRYKDVTPYFTPLNEPYVNAEYCGLLGKWPPYKEGLSGFNQLMIQLGKGIVMTVEEVKSISSENVAIHVDATKKYTAQDPSLEMEQKKWTELSMYSWEMIQGKLGENEILLPWIQENGVTDEHINWFSERKIAPDIVGVNYYPQFSVHDVKQETSGTHYPHVMGTAKDMMDIINRFFNRYQKPVFVTETSYRGTEKERINWLRASLKEIKKERERGKAILGYTWFPFYDLVDWEYRTSGKTIEEELLPFGLYTLTSENGQMIRIKNSVCNAFEHEVISF
ncbi:family 1 glycosylhydrolase [Fictibacillus terranigra]|uniref:Family 1 glycosylhydrolase n=1 Tax=Fictibacillus terranigra TaxID=3058424 RepID=A0ABT8EBU2_9BACL|nr:family 1 glycosylhydrolase [Fictibacillus sp. CENA-BCM004]MDN4075386.1 family 1 glycosylhydrolase [Fictibacillus sp. CENA-BCM004]